MAKTYDLNFRIKTDAKPTRKELEMTAAEFKDFNRIVKASKTPLDRFEKDLSDLNRAYKTGRIRQDQYAHGLKRIESQYAKTTAKQKKMFAGMKAGFGSGLAGMAAGFVGFHTVTKGLEAVKGQMEAIDKVAKSARGIGAKTEFLSGLEFAAQRASGLAEGAATKGIEKMTRRIEEAAQGTGEAVKALNMLGLEAAALAAMSPEEQFKVLSRAMDGVTDAGQRTLIATQLFSERQAKLHTTMALTNSEYETQIELAKKLGKIVTEEEARKAEAYVDSMHELDAMQAKYEKAMAMNAMGGLNVFAGESQVARGRFATAALEGDTGTKAELLGHAMTGGLFAGSMSGKAAEALSGRSLRAKTQEELDIQRAGYVKEDEAAQAKLNKELGQTLEWEQMLTVEQKKQERNSRFGNFFSEQLKEAKKAATAVKGGLGHLGLSVAGEIDRARNIRRGGADEFDITKVTTDPMESVGAGSSEAFKLFNQQTSLQKTEKDASKKTAANTKQSSDILGSILGFMETAKGLEL